MQTNKPDISPETQWLKWAVELQFIAQAGLTYSKDSFDIERFKRIREMSAEIMSLHTGMSVEHVRDVFCNETGFQTPKLDTRAAVFSDNKILLVRERAGTWSLPGGWVDVNESIRSNTIKEVKEESGYDAVPVKLIALQDRNRHNVPTYAYGVCKVFVLCEITGGEFEPNIETSECGFFGMDELPPLATEKTNKEQIMLCYSAYNSADWITLFD
ncbi:MAG: NUDIX hydrolase [Prevotellaceae bacterium]|nr:NUDIX hydrolase [Prevotellaceae bacterium]